MMIIILKDDDMRPNFSSQNVLKSHDFSRNTKKGSPFLVKRKKKRRSVFQTMLQIPPERNTHIQKKSVTVNFG